MRDHIISMYFRSLLLLYSCCVVSSLVSDVYPSSVPKFEIRKDYYTNKPVTSGHVHILPKKTTLAEFRRHLQCTKTDPNFNYNSGTISMLRMSPPTSKDYKIMSAFVEEKCGTWRECANRIPDYETRKYEYKGSEFKLKLNIWADAMIVRIINSTMHYDWPWGMERFKDYKSILELMFTEPLARISDMRDSVFFLGRDAASIQLPTMIPLFSMTVMDSHSDMIFPWHELFYDAAHVYEAFRRLNLNFTEEANYRKAYENPEEEYLEWDQRVPKAAYFTHWAPHRNIMLDIAKHHPDLFDAGTDGDEKSQCRESINPLDTSNCLDWYNDSDPTTFAHPASTPPFFHIGLNNVTFHCGRKYHPGRYKYVVVPLGSQPHVGLSTSGRIQKLLALSGSVILMPRSSVKYHFSARFLPWVHYVPLSFSGGDILEKVEWLRAHDDLARQIADNARNFARSYLRLEDYYCYTAAVLDRMADVSELTDAAKVVWNPIPAAANEVTY